MEVTAANAHRKLERMTATSITLPKKLGRMAEMNKLLNELQPVLAAASMSGTARIIARISMKPKMIDQSTACNMPL